ncbi:MAG: helix-turn-helix domain-containing protein [Cytophaga sp.]|uniref:helix-turn-helix domain-containing protein n=1 Tax=Cytophaga sp. TaxID=29535 RepID=UPI003F800658
MEKKPTKKATKAVKKAIKKPIAKKAIDKKTDKDIQKLATRIKTIRKKLGYTNADFFAYENEITRSQYARYETGENIRFSSLMMLIKAFGMTPQEFFSEGFE